MIVSPMAKRVSDEDYMDQLLNPRRIQDPDTDYGFRLKKFKNSLDSDEEDDEERAREEDVLDPEELEGQEEATIDYDGEIKITPFNMKDELEEGHFDKEGMFVFHKDQNEIRDSWLDNIDWIKIKSQSAKYVNTDEDSEDEGDPVDVYQVYRDMLEIVRPKETVQQAIRRLGGKSTTQSSASRRWNKNKPNEAAQASESDEDKEKLLQLTSLADKIISTGDMDIYQQSYERLSFLVKAKDAANKLRDENDALDMFGEDFDAVAVAASDAAKQQKRMQQEAPHDASSAGDPDGGVTWEFKWEEKEDAPTYGPYPSSEMKRWVEEGYFAGGVWVRRNGEAGAQFYSSRRIDFDLYC